MMNLPQSFVDARRMVDIYRDDLRRIGVSFDTEIQENASRSPQLIQHEMTAHVDTYQVFADPDIWRNFFHTEAIDNGRNYDSYSNPKVDDLFDRSRVELDRESRADLLRELQAQVQADQPALFLWNYSTTWGFSKRMLFFILGVEDRASAEAYMATPEAAVVGEEAGAVDGEYWFLEEFSASGGD